MGSLESGVSLKRDPLLRSSFLQRPRSRLSRFLLFKKLDYLQWICTVAVFLFFVALFQLFLPGSVVEQSGDYLNESAINYGGVGDMRAKAGVGFGEEIEFKPLRLMEKFKRESAEVNYSLSHTRTVQRFGYRKPQLALVFSDLLVDPHQLLMVTVAAALHEIGYEIQVYALEDGPAYDVWKRLGVPVSILQVNGKMGTAVYWLYYDGIIVNSLEARGVFSWLMQEPFKSLPLVWVIHDRTLALHSRQYISSGQIELLNDWKKVFNRATVVVFPNYFLPMVYSSFDAGNYYVIPGSPVNVWEANNIISSYKDQRVKMGFRPDDFIVTVVGSEFFYKSLWLEHALILEALLPIFSELSTNDDSYSRLKIIVSSGDSTTNYSKAVEAIAHNLRYPEGTVRHVATDGDGDSGINVANLVIYGSFLEEHSFPDILKKAMFLEKPIIAPNLLMIRKYVNDGVNGYIFPKENTRILTQILSHVISDGEISSLAGNVASVGRDTAKNMMVSEVVEGYVLLLENVLKLPSEVSAPKPASEIPSKLKEKWHWNLFEAFSDQPYLDRTLRSESFLNKIEEQSNITQKANYKSEISTNDSFLYAIWEEQRNIDRIRTIRRREEEELKDRTDQPRGTWEEVYRNAKRADRSRNDLHERDLGELERTGQPLCIYEPYYGEGTWPFLHHASLYRAIGLSTKGRRPGEDDIDASSRLPLLSDPYYRDALGEYGAFFAIANRVDRVHKNAWIGFQSWRATARKVSLSRTAEKTLLDAIQEQRHGDTLYFWVRMDRDPRNPLNKDFWSFCDAINAGNCRFAFSEVLKRMYGLKPDFNSLPPMPVDGGTWSVMHSWALPTRSFLEFVMFARMFVDALDAQVYDEHYQKGSCYLSLSKEKHCYSRLLELLVNVWAYHSGRRMVYVHPETGVMQEQHRLKSRRGNMWIRWFSYPTLKSMDEDLAEEADLDHPKRRWIWPSTGEVFWQGMVERERSLQRKQKEKRKQRSREKLSRMKRKQRQKAIGKYVKPPPEETENSNSTAAAMGKTVRL